MNEKEMSPVERFQTDVDMEMIREEAKKRNMCGVGIDEALFEQLNEMLTEMAGAVDETFDYSGIYEMEAEDLDAQDYAEMSVENLILRNLVYQLMKLVCTCQIKQAASNAQKLSIVERAEGMLQAFPGVFSDDESEMARQAIKEITWELTST